MPSAQALTVMPVTVDSDDMTPGQSQDLQPNADVFAAENRPAPGTQEWLDLYLPTDLTFEEFVEVPEYELPNWEHDEFFDGVAGAVQNTEPVSFNSGSSSSSSNDESNDEDGGACIFDAMVNWTTALHVERAYLVHPDATIRELACEGSDQSPSSDQESDSDDESEHYDDYYAYDSEELSDALQQRLEEYAAECTEPEGHRAYFIEELQYPDEYDPSD